MLDLNVTVEGDKVVISNLQQLAEQFPEAVDRGLLRAGRGIYQLAMDWLNGSGAQGISEQRESKTEKKYLKWEKRETPVQAGRYPVSVRSGHLKRMLAWLHPNQSKTGPAGTFNARPHEVVVFDSAIYAGVIHEGRGSSAKFGPRRFLTDALEAFNRGDGIKGAIEEEIQIEIEKSGF